MTKTTDSGAPSRRSSILPLIVLSLCGFTSVTTELLPAGLLTHIAADLETGIAAAGSLTAVYAASIVLTVLPLTRFTLRVPRRVLFTAVLGVFMFGNVLVALSPNLTVAIAGRVLVGIVHGLLWATLAPTVSLVTSPERAGRAMAIVFAGTSLGLAAGAPLGTLLGEALGWRWAFLVLAGVNAVLAVLAFISIPNVHPDTKPPLSMARAARLPGVGKIIVGWAFVLLAHFSVLTYIAPFLGKVGVDGGAVGAGIAVLGLAGLLGVTIAGRFPRRSLYQGLLAAPMLMLAAFIGLTVLPLNLVTAFVLMGVWGISYSATSVFNQQVILIVGHDAPDTVTSISVVVIQLGIAAGAALGGRTLDTFGVAWVPLDGAMFAAGSALMLVGLRSRLSHSSPRQIVTHAASMQTNNIRG